jgi:protein TonB
MFFSEEKNQKTFAPAPAATSGHGLPKHEISKTTHADIALTVGGSPHLNDSGVMRLVLAEIGVLRESPADRRSGSWRAASVSALLHGSVLAAVCILVAPHRMPQPPPPPSFTVVMAPPPAPVSVSEQVLQPAQVQQQAVPTSVPHLVAPLPLSLAPAELHFARRRTPKAKEKPVLEAQAVAAPAPVAAAVPPPPAPQAAVPRDVLSGLEARIRQAVQDAAIYPASARIMHLEGRTQVRFDYTDGAAGAADVASSSSSPMLDRAALAAVRGAALPRAPAEIGARRLPLLIWVEFRLVRQS